MPVNGLLEVMVPRRLGQPYRWLLASSWTSNVGDGIALAAGPLLVASQTTSPVLVALAGLLQRLPWLMFGLWAGAFADRADRRRVVIVGNVLRAVVVAVLCVAILTGTVSIGVVLVTMFLYGTAEVFVDTTAGTLLPALVPRQHLSTGTHRLQAGYLTCNQLVGPPVGAFLFALGSVLPFVVQVVCALLAVVLVARIAHHPAPDDAPGLLVPRAEATTHMRRDIAEGLRWLWGSPAVRMLAVVILVFNVTWAAAWSVLVLWSRDHLGMSEVGFGLLTTAAAVGGLLGTTLFSRIERRFTLATIMRTCLLLEVLMHLALANTTAGWVAIAVMFGFGAYAFVWGTVSQAVRLRAVPQEFQGRVGSVYMICVFAGMVAGQGLGGVIAEHWGLTAPFWFAFVGSGITLALIWRSLGAIAHADAAAA
ncbi:MFS transporter [Xylanimonas protaetiae]|uniref:MFS transporter n=1 Tax=Xylanimonas protaetiae TaxID=2509457 RepID=A0A4P6F0Z0_9MICO|nr:MFS transporter [Xylanimonas protaetiae]QAY69114.1 MFS transporter [Xylanimonas protaetiae]